MIYKGATKVSSSIHIINRLHGCYIKVSKRIHIILESIEVIQRKVSSLKLPFYKILLENAKGNL